MEPWPERDRETVFDDVCKLAVAVAVFCLIVFLGETAMRGPAEAAFVPPSLSEIAEAGAETSHWPDESGLETAHAPDADAI